MISEIKVFKDKDIDLNERIFNPPKLPDSSREWWTQTDGWSINGYRYNIDCGIIVNTPHGRGKLFEKESTGRYGVELFPGNTWACWKDTDRDRIAYYPFNCIEFIEELSIYAS